MIDNQEWVTKSQFRACANANFWSVIKNLEWGRVGTFTCDVNAMKKMTDEGGLRVWRLRGMREVGGFGVESGSVFGTSVVIKGWFLKALKF